MAPHPICTLFTALQMHGWTYVTRKTPPPGSGPASSRQPWQHGKSSDHQQQIRCVASQTTDWTGGSVPTRPHDQLILGRTAGRLRVGWQQHRGNHQNATPEGEVHDLCGCCGSVHAVRRRPITRRLVWSRRCSCMSRRAADRPYGTLKRRSITIPSRGGETVVENLPILPASLCRILTIGLSAHACNF